MLYTWNECNIICQQYLNFLKNKKKEDTKTELHFDVTFLRLPEFLFYW